MAMPCGGIGKTFFTTNNNKMSVPLSSYKEEVVVYKIIVEDLQHVSLRLLQRNLTEEEIAAVGNSVGDYIDWVKAIENAIQVCIR
jgi:hypothetical protein